MKQLLDRVAIVTGANSGIGQAIAEAYAGEGATMVLAARRRARLEAVADGIRKKGGTAEVTPTDVSLEEDVLELFRRTVETFGRVDILVNNAGTSTWTPTDQLTLQAWREVLDVNLTGAFLCSREALKIMKRQRGGRIINIGSTSAKVPRPHSAPYTTSKFALEGLTRSLALDGREHGVAVSILQAGNTASAMWHGKEEQARKEGVMSPDDLARIAVMIAALPADMNLLESVVLPLSMPFLGRS
jgi:NAD(P)-dependent dehydrogenase (short-subunit alcohol dehydrogenase family)